MATADFTTAAPTLTAYRAAAAIVRSAAHDEWHIAARPALQRLQAATLEAIAAMRDVRAAIPADAERDHDLLAADAVGFMVDMLSNAFGYLRSEADEAGGEIEFDLSDVRAAYEALTVGGVQ
jgi:hypothetical protein